MNGDGKNPFSHIDFTKFGAENINEEANLFQNWLANLDEEPTNFFGKGDLPNFHNKFDEMYSRFKNTKGDVIFRAFGHGDFGGIWDGDNTFIRKTEDFDKSMKVKIKTGKMLIP